MPENDFEWRRAQALQFFGEDSEALNAIDKLIEEAEDEEADD